MKRPPQISGFAVGLRGSWGTVCRGFRRLAPSTCRTSTWLGLLFEEVRTVARGGKRVNVLISVSVLYLHRPPVPGIVWQYFLAKLRALPLPIASP